MSVVPSVREILQARGIPNRRMEDWKYSDLRAAYEALEEKADWHAGLKTCVPISVDSIGASDGQLPDWVFARIDHLTAHGAMDVAARSFVNIGSVFRVPPGTKIELPLGIEHFGPGYGATVVFVEAGASLSIAETYDLMIGSFSDTSLLLFLDDEAHVEFTVAAPFSSESVVVETVSVLQGRNAKFRARVLTGGAKLSRTEFNITLAGEGAEADLSGATVLSDGAHADITTRIDHAVPNTTSRQLFKKVAGGKSRAVYQGKVTVREGAVLTDSRQTAKALLLGDRAEADLKPELEILADDVKCAHGAAVGDLDRDSLFYLRARGIPETEARGMLVHAFLQEVVDGIEDETFRASAVAFIDAGLARAMAGEA